MIRADILYVLVIQLATLLFLQLFFERFFLDRNSKAGRIAGVVLYMTCPYRVFVCMDSANIPEMIAWALLPLYGWAVLGLIRCRTLVWRNGITAAAALAGIGYADSRMILTTLGIVFLAAIFWKNYRPVAFSLLGCVLFAPGWYRLGKCLFTDAYLEMGISLQSIMDKGYRWGQFFTVYVFKDGHPGIGMGLMICLVMGMWMIFVRGEKIRNPERKKEIVFFGGIAGLLLFFSTRYCPWDFVQRLGDPFLRLVGMFRTPMVFWGYACACLCIPAAMAVAKLERQDDKIISFYVPMLAMIFSIGVCVYQCYGGAL